MSKNEIERLQGLKKLYETKLLSLKKKENREKQLEAFQNQIDQINQKLSQAA